MSLLNRKLSIFGAYGGVNLGDEMILRAAINLANAQGYKKQINIVVGHEPNKKSLERDYLENNLKLISYRKPLALLKSVIGRDLFIGGGQVIDGVGGVKLPLLQSMLALVSKLSGGNVYVLGSSTARLSEWHVRLLYWCLFSLCSKIELRDNGSAEQVAEIAPSCKKKIGVTADLVFSIKDQIAGEKARNNRKLIIFAPHHAPKLQLTPIDESVRFLKRLNKAVGPDFDIAILVHDVRPEFDYEFAQKLIALVDVPNLKLIVPETTDSLISYYQETYTIVSMRMHPIIIGVCAEAFCVPLKGSRKQKDLAERLNIQSHSLSELNSMTQEEFNVAIGLNADAELAAGAILDQFESDALKGFNCPKMND